MKKYISFLTISLIALVFASCDHTVSTETTVNADGSLEKTLVFESKDSAKNIFGVSEGNGWEKSVRLKDEKDSAKKENEFITTFKKRFASAEKANAELAMTNDSLFLVTSKFEKKFRWFYTYITYSETYHSLNRLKMKPDDYLVQEDYAFIDRLPAEGKEISKADEFYLNKLQERIFDEYGTRAYYDEYFELGTNLLRNQGIEQRWIDTMNVHKERIFDQLEDKKDVEDDYLLHVMDSLGVPVDVEKVRNVYRAKEDAFETKVNFISTASDGTYTNRINLPWTVVKSNADSVADKSLFWAPPSIKFLVKDYTMYGECRKMNVWAVMVSALVVALTLYLLIKKRSSS